MAEDVYVHPAALVETEDIGSGTRVWAFAHVMDGARVGADCKIGDHAYIESGAHLGNRVTVKNGSLIWHGVTIGDDVFVGPSVVFTNDLTPRVRHQTGPEDWIETHVGSRASIGANCTIVCGVSIGVNAMIGAGSVVTKNVADHALVLGNPAVQRGWACDCGAVLDESLECPRCGRRYEHDEDGLREVLG